MYRLPLCMDCPAGVDIPRVFSIHNHYKANGLDIAFINNYRTLSDYQQAHNCIGCGECLEHCPQGIGIPERMAEVAQLAEKLHEKHSEKS